MFVFRFFAFQVNASIYTIQCGHYQLEVIPGALNKVNGERVTYQRIEMLGPNETGMKVDMTLMPASDGNNYGFEYVHRPDSEVRFLNVQLLQANMDIPPIIASFPCRKLSD
ncbi:hypothetical protein EV102420_43_00050 [Pseudescherichia vulneris NBRC 102420]|uniref:Uncharacterized protein n=1 Tax=Pseudescherichia vulneris NBRC 102420 TaxID=1115515 RepID=A0A090VB00_PSEVU|nr:hypothetical protein [Pseudescherichia vulneris]GAL60539.1 hypothetical protein EV102420_43_00050 [Pseudescherichia vulneris NBRC 102420]STQ61092.1 Uncharacterised protein [Pseudescherichia vulneris]